MADQITVPTYEQIETILTKKYELMKNYDVSIFKWPKNFNNFNKGVKSF